MQIEHTVTAKGIYVPTTIVKKDLFFELLDIIDKTEINTVVVDIKSESGEITYDMACEMVDKSGAKTIYINDIEEFISELHKRNIYIIARIVAFKDPIFVKAHPEVGLTKSDGTLFKDSDGNSWINPYNQSGWKYLGDIAVEAINDGFDEVNFDYIRVPTSPTMKDVVYGDLSAKYTKTEIIVEFIKYVAERIHKAGGYISADVYGTVINSDVDAKIIGQDFINMSKSLDYICPMIYPSHYSNGYGGIEIPDAEPYELVLLEMQSATKKLAHLSENTATVRPWLQDFTATWILGYTEYEKEEVLAQIQAVYDAGYSEWFLWNASMKYTWDAFLEEE